MRQAQRTAEEKGIYIAHSHKSKQCCPICSTSYTPTSHVGTFSRLESVFPQIPSVFLCFLPSTHPSNPAICCSRLHIDSPRGGPFHTKVIGSLIGHRRQGQRGLGIDLAEP